MGLFVVTIVLYSVLQSVSVLILLYFYRYDVESALAELQLQLNFGYRVVNTPEELGLIVTQFTKAVAEYPFKYVFVC